MNKTVSIYFDGSITLENLIKEKEEILIDFPEATNFRIESKTYDYEQGYSYLIFSFEREETESEKERRLNAEDRESRIRVMNFKREQEALKKLGLIWHNLNLFVLYINIGDLNGKCS